MKWNNVEPDEGHPEYKEVVIEEKNEWGNVRYYPTNELGKKFASILGTKTLNVQVLDFIIKDLKIPVNFKPNELKWRTTWKKH